MKGFLLFIASAGEKKKKKASYVRACDSKVLQQVKRTDPSCEKATTELTHGVVTSKLAADSGAFPPTAERERSRSATRGAAAL